MLLFARRLLGVLSLIAFCLDQLSVAILDRGRTLTIVLIFGRVTWNLRWMYILREYSPTVKTSDLSYRHLPRVLSNNLCLQCLPFAQKFDFEL